LKAILLVTLEHLTTAFRERITLFWFIIFPMFLLVMLTLIFGNIGKQGQISFSMALANMETSSGGSADFSALVESIFQGAAKPAADGEEPLFSLTQPAAGKDKDAFIAREKEAVRLGNLSALIVIPHGFNQDLMGHITGQDSAAGSQSTITVYQNQGNAGSEMATSIIAQIIFRIDREILAKTGRFDEQKAVPIETDWIGSAEGEVPYVDFLLPGIILMGFFVTGLFGVPESILFARDRQILRRYWVTPLTVSRYIAGFSLGHVALCIVQFFFLYLLGRFAFGASLRFDRIEPVAFLLLSSLTFLAFGFLVASLAKTANSGMAIANILNMPMMFLGGLFFPISGLPPVLKALVFANPLTYLAEGLRVSLGVETGALSTPLTIVVPLSWIAICLLVASRRLKWDVGR